MTNIMEKGRNENTRQSIDLFIEMGNHLSNLLQMSLMHLKRANHSQKVFPIGNIWHTWKTRWSRREMVMGAKAVEKDEVNARLPTPHITVIDRVYIGKAFQRIIG